MSDLVERLREYAEGVEYSSDERILKEAADRIEQLEADLSDALTDLNTARQDNASCTVHIHNQADRIAQLEAALRNVMIGGNHIALLIGPNHPPVGTDHRRVLEFYGAGYQYDAWCCWNAIMAARAAVGEERT
jgi:hypothetical protein